MKKDKKRKSAKSTKRNRGKELRAKLILLAGSQCVLCGFDRCFALEFHHFKKKRFRLNSQTLGQISDDKLIMAEFRKCVLLCCNCHKGVHADEQYLADLNAYLKKVKTSC